MILSPSGNRSANVFSNLTRGVFGTEREDHDLDDAVQACHHLDATNCVDAVKDWLLNYGNIPSAYIIDADWNAEPDPWSGTSDITPLITKPRSFPKSRIRLEHETSSRAGPTDQPR